MKMKEIIKNKSVAIIGIFAIFLNISFISNDAFATVIDAASIQQLAILRGIYRCYGDYAKTQIYLSDFSDYNSISTKSNWDTSDDYVILPTKVGNTIGDWGLKCSETFKGFGSGGDNTSTGLSSYYTIPTDLVGLGYVFDHNDGDDSPDTDQISITATIVDDGKEANTYIPTKVTSNVSVSGWRGYHNGLIWKYYYWEADTKGIITAEYGSSGQPGYRTIAIEFSGRGQVPKYYTSGFTQQVDPMVDQESFRMVADGDTSEQHEEKLADAMKPLLDTINRIFVSYLSQEGLYDNAKVNFVVTNTKPTSNDPNNALSIYKPVSNGKGAAQVMFNKLGVQNSGLPVINGTFSTPYPDIPETSVYWNADFTYGLYYHYLENMVEKYPDIKIGACSSDKPSTSTWAFKGKKDNWCAIIIPNIANEVLYEDVAIVGRTDLEKGTFEDVLTWFNDESSYTYVSNDKYSDVEATDPVTPPPSDPDNPSDAEDDGTVTDEDLCYRNARSLGWIICPVIFGAREMSDSIYQAVIPLIQTNESIVGQLSSNDSGLYKAWAIFRNLANIIFVILFMIIIFSQLTGYGIDNYGIKRMLPKVIVTAILINLSFIICALAVDITNIIGTSIKGLFETIGAGVGNAVVTGSFGEAFGQVTQKVINALAILGPTAIIAGISIQMNGWAIVVPILLFLLTTVIAIFFALVVLGMRQALVVILIVLSPLAFACNMLPNTENIFKKWWSTAKTMLMVYPIVGALTGIGYLTARILLSADSGFIMVLVSGVLMVGPYFLIPSLTRKALDSVGSLGSRIGNIGRGARTGARNRINGAEAVKNFRGDHRDAATARRASRYLNSRQGRATEQALRDGKPISSRRANRYARAQAQANSSRKANLGAYDALFGGQDTERRLNRMQTGGFAAMEAGLANKAFKGDVADQAALWENDGTFANDAKFEDAVYNAAVNGEDAKLEALMRKAASGSDKQRENLFKGMSRAFASGNVGARTAGRYGAHLTSNGIYKSNDPSAYGLGTKLSSAVGNGNYGTSIDPKSFTQENYAGSRIFGGKVASASAFNFDDAEFNALAEKAKNGTAEERQQLANFMQGALDAKANDTTGQYNNVKPETIEQIKKVLGATGMTPQTAGETLTVDHSAAASAASDRNALDAYTESVIKRVLDTDNGGITAEEGEAMIRRAEEHWKQKHGGK